MHSISFQYSLNILYVLSAAKMKEKEQEIQQKTNFNKQSKSQSYYTYNSLLNVASLRFCFFIIKQN